MVNGFLQMTTYPAHWVCAIFDDFVPVVFGLDGLVLGSDDTDKRPAVLSYWFVICWSTFFSPILFQYCPCICLSFQFWSNLSISFTFRACVVEAFSNYHVSGRLSSSLKITSCLATEYVFLLFLIMPDNPEKGIILGVQIFFHYYH